MKKFNYRILTKRKIIIIFLLAIFLPTVIVGFLSIGTFSQRREAVKKLLESNRWVAGESAVNSLENGLIEYERKWLCPENFTDTLLSKSDASENLFLLDADFNIILPKIGHHLETINKWEKEDQPSPFGIDLQRAELLEFSSKNYDKAALLYRECLTKATTNQQRAMLLEKAGRCLLQAKNMDEAARVYKELGRDFGKLLNHAGHPYELIAEFQLCEITNVQKGQEQFLASLLSLYKQLRQGRWEVSQSVFDFYMIELETILNLHPKNSFTEILGQESPYRRKLQFAEFVQESVIPGIKDKIAQYRETDKAGRMLIHNGNDFTLVSYSLLPGLKSNQSFYGGFCWDTNLLKNKLIPVLLKNISKESGLIIQILDEKGINILSGQEEISANGSLQMNFRQFPLPWKLVAYYPETNTLEGNSYREQIFFGALLVFILGLMVLGVVLIVRDINREAETTRQKTEFVHTISHELKTPLTLIRLYGDTLQRKGNLTEQERQDCYEIITKESERLTHLINNVLDFSRIEMGRKEFDFKLGDLAAVIDETLEAYRYHLEKKGFVIRKELSQDLPQISFDSDAIASVLINLLSNALKFSLHEKEVTVKLFHSEGNIVLQVADKGIGISKTDQLKIFQRFYQAENKVISDRRGSGLGLTLVKHIVEAHHGAVSVESEPGKGSIFSVLLPLVSN